MIPRFPVILSSPSGGGKTTIAKAVLRLRPDVGYSVSCTTRPARSGESNGVDYHFLTPDEFDAAVSRGEFAEHAEVHGRQYGTLKSEVDSVLSSGRHVIMDIDVQGTRQFAAAYPDSVLIFIIPPDAQVLLERLKGRGTESSESLARRMRSAIEELRAVDLYGYLVVNQDLSDAVQAVSAIIDGETRRLSRLNDAHIRIGAMVTDLESELDKMNRRD